VNYGTYFIVQESAESYHKDPEGNPAELDGKLTIDIQLTYVVFGHLVAIPLPTIYEQS
jgi:hypothetical protein